jgi:general secretion pathway protein A
MSDTVSTLFEKRTRAFPLGPDKIPLFLGRDYRHALNSIRDDLKQGCRLLCLVGPAGMGKSMLLRTLRTQLPPGIVSEISQPPLGGLLSRLAAGLGMEDGDEDEAAVQQRFQEYFAAPEQGDSAVIQVIDDAECLTRDDLALLRRLFEPVQGQILLIGQPPLLSLFATDNGDQNEIQPDRIYNLEPLSLEEVGAYIRHRLNEAGYDRELFVPEAVAAVSAYSGGLPRLVNLLCFMALASSEFDVSAPISADTIHDAARQRLQTGNYPFVRPPLAPGWRPIPTPAAVHDSDKAHRNRRELDERSALSVGKPRGQKYGSARFGYGSMVLTLMTGVTLGIIVSQVWMTGNVPQTAAHSADATAAMSRPLNTYLRGMRAGLVKMAEWVIDWAGPASTSAANTGMAPEHDAGAAPHREVAPSQAALALPGGTAPASHSRSRHKSPTLTGLPTTAALRGGSTDVASQNAGGIINSTLTTAPFTAVKREHIASR